MSVRPTSSCATERPCTCAPCEPTTGRRCAPSSSPSRRIRSGFASSGRSTWTGQRRGRSTSTMRIGSDWSWRAGNPRAIIAHAAYVRLDHERAEVAFLVADAWQGRGISTILLAHLAEVAEQHGISTLFAQVLPHNHRMIDVFRESGFPVELRSAPDALEVELPTSLSTAAVERFEERERIGAVAAVRSFLEPRSVAVIGASRRRGTIGGEILHNLLAAEFSGAVYAVNDKADVVQSLPAYRSVRRHSRRGRVGDRGGSRRAGGTSRARVRGRRRAQPARDLVGVRGDRCRGRRPPARAARGVPRRRDPDRRSQLPGRAQHVPATCG